MRALTLAFIFFAITGCAAHHVADEPQDLVAQDQTLDTLLKRGWKIDAPADPAAASASIEPDTRSQTNDRQTWAAFLARLEPGDELRAVRNNAGAGHAIFRDGRLVSLYLLAIY